MGRVVVVRCGVYRILVVSTQLPIILKNTIIN